MGIYSPQGRVAATGYTLGPGSLLPTDGPSAVYVPASAADWTTLGITAPNYQWNCQDTIGTLVAAIGAYDLPTLAGTRLYQQTVTGWTRKFFGWDTRSDTYAVTTDAATTPGASESFAVLAYVGFTVPAGVAQSNIVAAGGDNTSFSMLVSASKRQVQTSLNGAFSTVTGVEYGDDVTVIRPVLFGRNVTAGTATTFTNLETYTTAYAAAALSSATKGWISFNARATTVRGGLLAMWRGAVAEAVLAKATLTTLRWSVPY